MQEEPEQEAEAPPRVEGEAEPAGEGIVSRELEEALRRAQAAEERAADLLGQLQRLKADFDNYRRRMLQEQARWQETAVASFLRELLPVLDNLERAIAAAPSTGEERGAGALRQGLELTLRHFHGVLERAGVSPINAAGQPFDPNRHEAMMRVVAGEHPEDTVVEELQKGYIFKGQVLRPSLVKVAVAPGPAAVGDDAANGLEG